MKNLSEMTEAEYTVVSQIFWGTHKLRLHSISGMNLVESLFLKKREISARVVDQIAKFPERAQAVCDHLKKIGYDVPEPKSKN